MKGDNGWEETSTDLDLKPFTCADLTGHVCTTQQSVEKSIYQTVNIRIAMCLGDDTHPLEVPARQIYHP